VALAAAAAGHVVTGFDTDEEVAGRLAAGRLPADLAHLERALAESTDEARYHATSDEAEIGNFDIAVVAVPTGTGQGATGEDHGPTRQGPTCLGPPDLSCLDAAIASLARHLPAGALVVVESTVPPGTTRGRVAPALEAGSGLVAGHDFAVGFSPERVDPGNGTWSLATTAKLVSGIDATSRERCASFYRSFVEEVVEVDQLEAAELAKVMENGFRYLNIAFVNELSVVARASGVDINQALDAAGTKPFGYMAFRPGAGAGGECLATAAAYLASWAGSAAGARLSLMEAAAHIDAGRGAALASRLEELLSGIGKPLQGSTVLVAGLTYKSDIPSTARSPGIRLANELVSRGAMVLATDPYVTEDPQLDPAVKVVRALDASVSDITVLVTAHSSWDLAALAQSTSPVLDLTGALTGPSVHRL